MHSSRTLLLVAIVLMVPLSAFAQIPGSLSISPETIHRPPATPSCYTIAVPDGSFMTLDLEITSPSGPEVIYGWPTLDANGEASVCADSQTAFGQYIFTGVRNTEYPWLDFTLIWASLTVRPANPPVVNDIGTSCANWDCIWMTGTGFQPDSRVIVYSANWTRQETYYGPSWQTWPPLSVREDNQWLALQIADPELSYSMGWDGVYALVVNSDESLSLLQWVKPPQPQVDWSSPTCADSYCIQFSGSFPLSAYVDFRLPGSQELILDAYTDLVVTESRITLRLNPGVRQAYDTSGLYAWIVNPTVANWSAAHYLPPVDRSITGYVEGIRQDGDRYYLAGWACAKTYPGSIELHVYAGGASGDGGTLVFGGMASLESEPAVATACHATGTNYRFYLPIPDEVTQHYGGQRIYVHGISPLGLPNLPVFGSGEFTIPAVDHSVIGWLAGVSTQGASHFLYGWACARTHSGSIAVQIYAGGPAGSGGTFTFSGVANVASEPAVSSACNSTGVNHRFWLQIPPEVLQQYLGRRIFVHGISPFGLGNSLLNGSGRLTMPGSLSLSAREFIYLGDRAFAVEMQ